MGFFSNLFGGGRDETFDVETEYKGFIDSTECLAKVGAELGSYDFFMHVHCDGKNIYITMEMDFLDRMRWVQSSPSALNAFLRTTGITHEEYEFFMRNIRIEKKDERHDIGKTKIIEEFKSAKCSKAVLDVLKSRLVNVKNTYHRIEENTISLHDE